MTDSFARARSYIARTTGLSDEARQRRALSRLQRRFADDTRETPDTTPRDWSVIEGTTTLPEPDASMSGRLLIQRRDDANDILYVCIVTNNGTPRWIPVSELQETAEEVGLWKWTQMNGFQDRCIGISSTGTELLHTEKQTFGSYARVRRRNLTTGASIGTFGTIGTGNGQFTDPAGLAVSAGGNIHVADSTLNRVVQFNSSRTFVRNIGSTGTGNGNLTAPYGVACDSSNNVYVADSGNKRVAVFNSSGTWQRNIGTAGSGAGQLQSPYGVAVSSTGELYVSDNTLNKVVVYNASNGTYLRQFGTFGAGVGQFNAPRLLALDGSDNLFVADLGNRRFLKVNSTGEVLATIIGAFGYESTSWANGATGVATSGSNLYVTAAAAGASYGSPSGVKLFSIVPKGGTEFARDGTTFASRPKLNFVSSTGVSVTIADDSSNGEADITLAIPTATVFSSTFTVLKNGGTGTKSQSCDTGRLVSGGCYTGGSSETYAYFNAPSVNSGSVTSWRCDVYNGSAVDVTSRVWAVCLV